MIVHQIAREESIVRGMTWVMPRSLPRPIWVHTQRNIKPAVRTAPRCSEQESDARSKCLMNEMNDRSNDERFGG